MDEKVFAPLRAAHAGERMLFSRAGAPPRPEAFTYELDTPGADGIVKGRLFREVPSLHSLAGNTHPATAKSRREVAMTIDVAAGTVTVAPDATHTEPAERYVMRRW